MRYFVLFDFSDEKVWVEVRDMQAAYKLAEKYPVPSTIVTDSFASLEQAVKGMDENLEEAITRLSGALK